VNSTPANPRALEPPPWRLPGGRWAAGPRPRRGPSAKRDGWRLGPGRRPLSASPAGEVPAGRRRVPEQQVWSTASERTQSPGPWRGAADRRGRTRRKSLAAVAWRTWGAPATTTTRPRSTSASSFPLPSPPFPTAAQCSLLGGLLALLLSGRERTESPRRSRTVADLGALRRGHLQPPLFLPRPCPAPFPASSAALVALAGCAQAFEPCLPYLSQIRQTGPKTPNQHD